MSSTKKYLAAAGFGALALGLAQNAEAETKPMSAPMVTPMSTGGPRAHGFMIHSDTNPNLVANAWGGAVNGGYVRLTDACTPENTDCTWSYKQGMIVSDKDPTLAINAWGGAAQGTQLRLSNACTPSNTDCTWTYRHGEFFSDKDPYLAINAYGGASVGTYLELVNGCGANLTDCTWTLPHVMISSETNSALSVNAYGGAANDVALKLVKGCDISLTDCTWTFQHGMILSDTNASFALNAYGGARDGAPVEIVAGCDANTPDCTWTWSHGEVLSDNSTVFFDPRSSTPPFAINAYGGATSGTSLLLESGCNAQLTDCVFDGLVAGPVPPLPSSLNWHWDEDDFGGGGIHGMDLTLNADGSYTFSGAFWENVFPGCSTGMDDAAVVAVKAANGDVLTFSRNGTMSGGCGSQNDSWSITGTNALVKSHWYGLQGVTPQGQVAFQLNTNDLWNSIASVIGVTSAIYSIVAE